MNTQNFRVFIMLLILLVPLGSKLTVIEQTLHARHRPPPGLRHLEVPERLAAARDALKSSPFHNEIDWRCANDSPCTAEDALTALKRVHTADHLSTLQRMSKTGGGFDRDTYWFAHSTLANLC